MKSDCDRIKTKKKKDVIPMNDRLDLVSFLQGLLFVVCCIGWGVISYTSAYSGSFEDSAIVIITLLLISALIALATREPVTSEPPLEKVVTVPSSFAP